MTWKLFRALLRLLKLLLPPLLRRLLFLMSSASKPLKPKPKPKPKRKQKQRLKLKPPKRRARPRRELKPRKKPKPHKVPLAVLAPPVKRELAPPAAKLPPKVSPELPPGKALPGRVRVRVARQADWAGGLRVRALWVTWLRSATLMLKLPLTQPLAILVQP